MNKTLPPTPTESGKGDLCAPVENGVTQREFFLIVFEDQDRQNRTFTDRDTAREHFARLELGGWNCHLFEHMKRADQSND